MRLRIVSGGGLAGIISETVVDDAALSPTGATEFRSKVAEAVRGRSFTGDSPDSTSRDSTSRDAGSRGADSFPDSLQYEITVEDGENTLVTRRSQSALTPQLRALVDWANSTAGRQERLDPTGGSEG